jgi:dsRNA-specific ribonuclease
MSEVKAQTDFLSIFYSFLNSANTFGSSMKEYEEKYKGRSHEEVLMDMIKSYPGSSVLTQNENVADYLIDTLVPEQYRTLARGAKKLPLPQFLDIASSILKKYGEDGNGGYKTAEEFIDDLIKEQAKRMFKR